MDKSYSELMSIPTFEERYRYLKLGSRVGDETFGSLRHMNQQLYTSDIRWKQLRNRIIVRDDGCDLAMPDFRIYGKVIVHHINPITIEDFMDNNPVIFDPENLICVSFNTHQAIHYGDESLLPQVPIVRTKNDTCLWRK